VADTEQTTEFVNEDAEAQQDGQQPQSLGLQELATLAQIVDLASQRGAFRGNELSQVGALYDKLNNFLSYVQAQQQAAQEAEAEAEAEGAESGEADAPSEEN